VGGVNPIVGSDRNGLLQLAGRDLPPSEWLTITQERVDAFAQCTDDPQWIHVDPERAALGPYGGTVAHGFLTLSLITRFWERTIRVDATTASVNYGLNRVRFPSPVKVGTRVRAHFRVTGVTGVPSGLQLETTVTIENEGVEKPACVAETLVRFYFDEVSGAAEAPVAPAQREALG
jgi:acyl dehydratase